LIIKQFQGVNKDLIIEDGCGGKYAFNPSTQSLARLKIIYKFISLFPKDSEGDPVSTVDITPKELCDCELEFSSWLNNQGENLPIFESEWDRILEFYKDYV